MVVAVVGAGRDVLQDPYVATAVAAIAELAGDFEAGVGLEWLPIGGSRSLYDLATRPDVCGVVVINTTHELLAELPRARRSGRVVRRRQPAGVPLRGRQRRGGQRSRQSPDPVRAAFAGHADRAAMAALHRQWGRYQDVMTEHRRRFRDV